MADPFLVTHLVAPLWADIGGPIHPISIRDQMVRAQAIVERAHRASLIGPGRPLLIIGAGAAGVTAALAAERLGVQTLLIDRAAAPIDRLRRCRTRWIDPAQYDWPHPWWNGARYPWIDKRLVRPRHAVNPWTAERASVLAGRWTGSLLAALRRPASPLRLGLGYTLGTGMPTLGPGARPLLTVPLTMGPRSASVVVGLVLACVGFGNEVTSAAGVNGPRFWEDDPLELPRLGLSTGIASVLISGAGDGSLQDFIRASTGLQSARAVLDAIAINDADAQSQLQLELLELLSIEEHVARASAWEDPTLGLSDLHETLHAYYAAAVTRAKKIPGLIDAVKPVLRTDAEVALVSRTDYFPQCYGLNRFVALLLAEAAHAKAAPFRLHYGCELTSVTPMGAAVTLPSSGGPFYASFKSIAPGSLVPGSGPYDAVIIRHGIAPPIRSGHTRAAAISRHLLPYRPV